MTSLFKVTYRRKTIMTRYEGTGRKQTSTTSEIWTDVVINDMPYATAKGYLTSLPADAHVRIEAQPQFSLRHEPIRGDYRVGGDRGRNKSDRRSSVSSPSKAAEVSVGDYKDLVNAMVKETA